ncbi:MAG: hypothetical protein GXO07_01655 [Crenarchaeota archaeon]|nr:hypothetical protein [Thermoproteota archaeon]
MRFVARVDPRRGAVVLAREDGKVRVVSLQKWRSYLSKCKGYGAAYLCRRAIIVGTDDMYVGVVTRDQPMPKDLKALRPLVERYGIPDFVLEDVVALMYHRDSLVDLSCVGCREGKALLEAVPA